MDDLIELSEVEYKERLLKDGDLKQEAYRLAWEAKNFEIENYWKRAQYFWIIQVTTFTGYFALLNSQIKNEETQYLFVTACIGFITSLAWFLTNKGSKLWQRNWENHVDKLEDSITGPLYKTVSARKSFSVSKINEIVSFYFIVVWFSIIVAYFTEHISFYPFCLKNFDYWVAFSTIVTLATVSAMIFGYGRGRFSKREVKFYGRNG